MIVLVPTKELGMQVTGFLKKLTLYCEGLISVCNATSGGASVQKWVEDGFQNCIGY